MTPTKAVHKTARMLALVSLGRGHALDRYTYQQLADVFQVNRSTIFRDFRAIEEARELVVYARRKLARMVGRKISPRRRAINRNL